jgi:uncharacterized XkdX family phage protein
MWYTTVKRYYDNGHPAYTADAVKAFVKAKMITNDEYKQITGINYSA